MSEKESRVEKMLFPVNALNALKNHFPEISFLEQEFTGSVINKLSNQIDEQKRIINNQNVMIKKHNEAIEKLEKRLQEKVKNVSDEVLAIQTMMEAYSFETKFVKEK